MMLSICLRTLLACLPCSNNQPHLAQNTQASSAMAPHQHSPT